MSLNLKETFEKFEDDFLKFADIAAPLHPRPDLCGLILLDKLCPKPKHDMISASEHDEFYLSVYPDQLAEVATEEDIQTLVRCGIRYDSELDCLCMFA
jgi:hypothetical protein